jgi:hypothetical protein
VGTRTTQRRVPPGAALAPGPACAGSRNLIFFLLIQPPTGTARLSGRGPPAVMGLTAGWTGITMVNPFTCSVTATAGSPGAVVAAALHKMLA